MFLVKGSDEVPRCPNCGGILKYRDSRRRICRQEGGQREQLQIRRFRCTQCHAYHNELPDLVAPYKHYRTEVICGVLDGIVTPEDEDSEDYPSVNTMLRWLRWLQMNLANIEGFLRDAGYRILGLGEAFLFSGQSLLGAIRNRHPGWLEIILRIIYNSGGFLPAIRW